MELSFNKLKDDGEIEYYTYNVPKDIANNIITNLDLDIDQEYVFSFSNFVEFDYSYYNPVIEFFLNKMSDNIEKKIIGIDTNNDNNIVTYHLKNIDELGTFDKDRLLFLCALLHNLDLIEYMIPIVTLLSENFGLSLDYIKTVCKNDIIKVDAYIRQIK